MISPTDVMIESRRLMRAKQIVLGMKIGAEPGLLGFLLVNCCI